MPDPISSYFLTYELVPSKRFPIRGNHNFLVRPLSYGTIYREKDPGNPSLKSHTENTSILYAGYHYAIARHTLNLTPYVENYYRNSHTNFQLLRMQADWNYYLTPRLKATLQGGVKRYYYKEQSRQLFADYTQRTIGGSLSYTQGDSTSLYGGVDFTRRKYAFATVSSKEVAVRAGMFHQFQTAGIYANLLAFYRVSLNDEFNFFQGVRRKDKQQLYVASFGSTKLTVFGSRPELRFKHTANRSNSILYEYKQNEISLQLRKTF